MNYNSKKKHIPVFSITFICLFVIYQTNLVTGASRAEEEKFQLAKSYLCRYGYLPKNICYYKVFRATDFLKKHAQKMRDGLVLFQKMFKLRETGKISSSNLIKMGMPRCGNEDQTILPLHSKSKFIDYRKIFNEGTNEISYSIRNFNFYAKTISKNVTNQFIDKNINKAFQTWFASLNANLKVRKIRASYEYFKNTPRGNVTFVFGEGRHGDAMPFDGENGELGHASALSSLSSFKGQVHLDDDENWKTGDKLYHTLVHEIGHLFGLDHSSNPNSIMSPIINQRREKVLDDEDIKNLQLSLGLKLNDLNGTTHENATFEESIDTAENTMVDTIEESMFDSVENTMVDTIEDSMMEFETSTLTSTTTTVPTTTVTKRKLSFVEELLSKLKSLSQLQQQNKKIIATIKTTRPTTTITTTITTTTATTATTTTTTTSTTRATSTTTATTTTKTISSTAKDIKTILNGPFGSIESIIDEIINNKNLDSSMDMNDAFLDAWKLEDSDDSPYFPTTSSPVVRLKASKSHLNSPESEYEYLLKLLGAPAKLIMLTTANMVATSPTTQITTSTSPGSTRNEPNQTELVAISSPLEQDLSTILKQQQTHESKQMFFDQFCKKPEIDEMVRTEWGNVYVFKGDLVWHVKGLTKWRIVDYEGWPKKISTLFPQLPDSIDAAYLLDNHYFFTKGELIWKFTISNWNYQLVDGYPKLLTKEFPKIPFKSVDSAFSSGSSVFFFKDLNFWQSTWNSSLTHTLPFKTTAALNWKHPGRVLDYAEPLAYIVSGVSMHQFNYWNVYLQSHNVDVRYFLFDCMETNHKPKGRIFIGPSYNRTDIDDLTGF